MANRTYLCFYEGAGSDWEAISVDFDIAVCGSSLDEVKTSLRSAIHTYIEEANKENKTVRDRLLRRRMPILVYFGWHLKIIWQNLRPKKQNSLSDGKFDVPCQA